MSAQELFEVKVMMAAEDARRCGFENTYLALIDVLRTTRLHRERSISRSNHLASHRPVQPNVPQQ